MRPTIPTKYYSLRLGVDGKAMYDFFADTDEEAVSMAKLELRRWERLGRDITKATLVKVMPHPTAFMHRVVITMA